MHLHFVFPRWQKLLEGRPELREALSGYEIGDFRMAGLGVATAAGAVPAGHGVTLVDENAELVDTSVRPDLVCLGFFTPQATSAYAIADRFRAAGVKVLGGGIHPTMAPEDALVHCDAVVQGPVEGLWERILADLAAGRLERCYRGDPAAPFARPRRDLFRRSGYLRAGIVQTARGCHLRCDFCIVPECYGRAVVLRPIAEVIEDIATLPYGCFFFGDENLLFPDAQSRAYTRELLRRMIEGGEQRDCFMATYPHFLTAIPESDLALMAAARVRQIYLIMGLSHPIGEELHHSEVLTAVQRMKEHGIEVLASFTLGHDGDVAPVAPAIANFCERTRTNLAEFVLGTPFPGTALYAALERAGRIIDRRWEHYNGAHVVFQPRGESPESLRERYVALWRWFYGPISRLAVRGRCVRGFGRGIFTPAGPTSS
ncbi:MAG: cobalamin B12-binding domain-containing protein [Deltaproteobacteria bacterium]|nr:cobalamin B12-binding domain-containing protein [Deltaproteobacteria bacterium]